MINTNTFRFFLSSLIGNIFPAVNNNYFVIDTEYEHLCKCLTEYIYARPISKY